VEKRDQKVRKLKAKITTCWN